MVGGREKWEEEEEEEEGEGAADVMRVNEVVNPFISQPVSPSSSSTSPPTNTTTSCSSSTSSCLCDQIS